MWPWALSERLIRYAGSRPGYLTSREPSNPLMPPLRIHGGLDITFLPAALFREPMRLDDTEEFFRQLRGDGCPVARILLTFPSATSGLLLTTFKNGKR